MQWYQVPDFKVTGQPFVKRVKAGGKTFCLVGYEHEIYALSARCPHAGGDLTQGWCKEGKLICPIHRYSYDLETGKGSPGQNDYIDSYPVEIRDGSVYIGVNSLWEKIKQAFR
jgi:3-phenylpropionate/trans-cinnamate dioxygenase ferredoxin subunit